MPLNRGAFSKSDKTASLRMTTGRERDKKHIGIYKCRDTHAGVPPCRQIFGCSVSTDPFHVLSKHFPSKRKVYRELGRSFPHLLRQFVLIKFKNGIRSI